MWEITVSIGFLAVLTLVTDRRTRPVVVVAYLIRMVMAYVHAYVVPLPDSQFDAIRFERMAWTWARDGQCFDDFTTGSLLYSWIGSCVYLVVGRKALVLQLANCFVGALIVLVGMRTARLLPHVRSYDRKAGWAIALYPSLVLYSAIMMREAAVVFCFAVSAYFLTRWASGDGYRYAVWAILWVAVSQLFHTGMVAATVTVVAVVMYVTIRENWRGLARIHIRVQDAQITVASLVLAGTLIGLGALALSTGFGVDKLQQLTEVGADFVEVLGGWQQHVARGRASYLGSLQPDSWLDVLVQTPVRLAYFLGAPFAWMVAGVRDLWGFLDGTFLLISLRAAARVQHQGSGVAKASIRHRCADGGSGDHRVLGGDGPTTGRHSDTGEVRAGAVRALRRGGEPPPARRGAHGRGQPPECAERQLAMKVMAVAPSLARAGAERVVSLLSLEWNKSCDVVVVLFDGSEAAYEWGGRLVDLKLAGRTRIGSRARVALSGVGRLARLYRLEQPDRIVSFMEPANFPSAISAALAGVSERLTVSVHHDSDETALVSPGADPVDLPPSVPRGSGLGGREVGLGVHGSPGGKAVHDSQPCSSAS